MKHPKIRIPWFKLIGLLATLIPELVAEIQKATSVDSEGGRRVTENERQDIFMEHFLFKLGPSLWEIICEANGWKLG